MLKKILFFILLPFAVLADDCVQYKKTPFVNIKKPEWTKTVELSDDPMDEYDGKYFSFKLHGITETSFMEKYNIDFNVIPERDGYCVIVNGVDATVGYENFLVKIDKSHKKNSCSYNAVLKHEEKHIDAYLSILKDMAPDIKNSIFNTMNSVMPIYAPNIESIDSLLEDMYKKLEKHPEIVLLHQKINAAQEIRNKRIDQDEDNYELKMCE